MMCVFYKAVYYVVLFYCVHGFKRGRQVMPPPEPKDSGYYVTDGDMKDIESSISSWEPAEGTNPWEVSGLIEGDILPILGRNGLRDKDFRWKNGVVPFYISELEFDDKDIATISDAINEYHDKTCIKFRPYKLLDKDFVIVRSSRPGCWSSVGKQSGGQVVNLQTPGCNHRGVVIHELLHALGFFHQQSASDRDEHVRIHWQNIQEGRENNFEKYNDTIVSSFEESYDYSSIMHYSSKAFTKNGNVTIEPLMPDAEIGQRDHLSDSDIKKLNAMYKKECENRENKEVPEKDFFSFLFPSRRIPFKSRFIAYP